MAGTNKIYIPPEQNLQMENWIKSKLQNQPQSAKSSLKTYLSDLIDNAGTQVPSSRKKHTTHIQMHQQRSTRALNGSTEADLNKKSPQITLNTHTSLTDCKHTAPANKKSTRSKMASRKGAHKGKKDQGSPKPITLKEVIQKYSKPSFAESRHSLQRYSLPSSAHLPINLSQNHKAHFSEFSIQSQSFCFSKSKRNLDFSTDKSPGPALYSSKSTLNTSGTKISKSKESRSKFLNPEMQNPAPSHYYPSKHFLSK